MRNLGGKSPYWQNTAVLALPEGTFADFGTRIDSVFGTGYPDIIVKNRNIYKNRARHVDFLKKISNGLGGEIAITYKPSTEYDNTGGDGISDLSFPVYTVSSVTSSDGQGNSYTTNYEYKNGMYSYTEREFRGFGFVKVIDADGNYSENYFKQDDIYKGRPDKQLTYDSFGNLFAKSESVWNSTTLYPGVVFPYLESTISYLYDGQPTPNRSRTNRFRNSFYECFYYSRHTNNYIKYCI